MDLVILYRDQMTKTIPELALPLQISTPQQREDYPMRIGLLLSKRLVIQRRCFSSWRIRYKIKIRSSKWGASLSYESENLPWGKGRGLVLKAGGGVGVNCGDQ
ncbi:hypothetical protein AVEN_200277-1 [Araneus ventricosus]|uniref:Uncharacterized protein n=1 Tax=Araneus ventricosus TaxID=182803 RepID=A0A4Y2NXZ2_ARAVE|nr:hypothetical protein AVEN_200277-1 [Araneus ventricosus]